MSFPEDRFQLGDTPRYVHRRPPRRQFAWIVGGMAAVALLALVWRATASDTPATAITPVNASSGQGAAAAQSPGSPALQDSPAPSVGTGVVPMAIRKLIDYGKPVYCGGGNLPMVALTFDDGPGPFTAYTLDTLQAAGAKASFFLVSKLFYSPTYQKLARREGHFGDVGDHSQSHFGLAGEPMSILEKEVAKPQRLIEQYSGKDVIYFRPPWGSRDQQLDDYVRSLGMLSVMWTFDTYDSHGAKADEIAAAVAKHAVPGAIILMHENRGTTRAALPAILQAVADKGLQPVTLTTMLTQDPPTKEQVRQGGSGC